MSVCAFVFVSYLTCVRMCWCLCAFVFVCVNLCVCERVSNEAMSKSGTTPVTKEIGLILLSEPKIGGSETRTHH